MSYPKNKLPKNINLSYLLVFLNNSFFWYAPWLLFFLNFITLRQSIVLQSIGLFTSVVFEIPTGALADLIGKKKTLHLAFLLTGIGEMYMAFSTIYSQFVVSYIVLNIGYSLYSGTMEAFTYDTLVSENKESGYNKVISKFHAFSNAGTAMSSIIGGFLYSVWIGLPFFATGIAKLIGFVVTFFIDEPTVDTDKFSLKNFFSQSKKGFKHLFDKELIGFSILLLSFAVFHVPAYEIIDDMTVIDFGYAANAIGILYAVAIFIAIPSSLFYEKVSKRIQPIKLIYGGIFVLALQYIFVPWLSVGLWTCLFLMRVAYRPLRSNAISEIINKNTSSKIRATTLSTFSMLKILPFVLLSGFWGTQIENVGIRTFNAIFYGLMLVITIPQIIRLARSNFELNKIN